MLKVKVHLVVDHLTSQLTVKVGRVRLFGAAGGAVSGMLPQVFNISTIIWCLKGRDIS